MSTTWYTLVIESTDEQQIGDKQINNDSQCYAKIRRHTVLSIACPTVLAVGTLGNVLCFITLRGKSFGSSPTNFILSTMLVVDQGILRVTLVWFWLNYVFEIDLMNTHSIACTVLPFIASYFKHVSSFLVCLLTVERLIAVYVPLRCKQLCSARRIKIVCFSAFVAYFLINGYLLYSMRLDTNISEDGTLEYMCRAHYLLTDWHPFIAQIIFSIDAILTTYIPATLLVVLNALIVYKIVASRRAMQTSGAQNDANASNNKVATVTVMLLAECAFFLLLNSPSAVFSTIVTIDYGHCSKLEELHKYFDVLNFTSSALNFVMYMLAGRKFRKAFVDTLCSCPVNAVV